MIIDGKQIAQNLRDNIAKEVAKLDRKPGLAVVLIGDNPASQIYVNNKEKACIEVGFYSQKINKPSNTTQAELLAIITRLNQDDRIDGILVQLPLPDHISANRVIKTIDYTKDVDGFHSENIGRLMQNKPFLRPCTPKGIMYMLAVSGVEIIGKNCVIIGSSNIVGRPMAMELLNKRGTITICNSKTKSLSTHLAQADIVVAAAGRPEMVLGKWLKKGCVVIDVGINRLNNGRLVGDVDFNSAKEVASLISPVPGGVGPMTIASLLENTLIAYKNRIK